MADSGIKALDRSVANGHPSGHAMSGMFVLLIIFEDFFFGSKFWIKIKVSINERSDEDENGSYHDADH
jgi:hypothetical protein